MQTLVFQTEKESDINLLLSLTQRLGIQQTNSIDVEFLHLLNNSEIRIEIAVLLFVTEKFSLGKASEFARLHSYEFQKILAAQKIPIHYDVAELHHDLSTIKKMPQ